MLDILMWPWVERRKSLSLIYDEPTNFNDGNFSQLVSLNMCERIILFLKIQTYLLNLL